MAALLGIDVANVGQGHVFWLTRKVLAPGQPEIVRYDHTQRRGSGPIDWVALSRSGAASTLSWAVAKVTEGLGFNDPEWANNHAALTGKRLPHGGYHMLNSSPGAAQADHYLTQLGGAKGLALDVELPGSGGQVRPFLDRLTQRRPGEMILVYSSAGLWSYAGAGGVSIAGYPNVYAWHAGYRNGQYYPGGGSPAAIWSACNGGVVISLFGGLPPSKTLAVQYTDHATVSGASGGVDADAWLGTPGQLTAWAGGSNVSTNPLDAADASTVLNSHVADLGHDDPYGNKKWAATTMMSITMADAAAAHQGIDKVSGQITALQQTVNTLKAGGVDPAVIQQAIDAAVTAALPEISKAVAADVLSQLTLVQKA